MILFIIIIIIYALPTTAVSSFWVWHMDHNGSPSSINQQGNYS